MPARTIIAKNNTGSAIFLQDLGTTIPASSNLTLTDILTTREITQSQELKTQVTSGDVTINDGTDDLSVSNGLREISFETEWEDIENSESGWVIRETEPFNAQDGKGWLKPGDNNTLYILNEDKNKMLSVDRIYLTFQKQGTADAEYLKVGNVQSTDIGYKLNRNGTIVGATIKITGGYNEKKFFIRDNGTLVDELQLPVANSLIEDLDIDFDTTSLLQIFVCEEGISREDWYNQNWGYRMKITIDYTKVSGGANLTNFPILVSLVNANLTKARSDGYDILFTSSDGETKLDHEIESFTQGSGTLVAWVKIPTLSYTVNTEIYIYYGYGSSTNQQNVTGVWSNGYVGVWHFHNNSFADSSPSANNASNSGSSNATGKIAGARSLNGSTNYISVSNSSSLQLTSQMTLEGWIYANGAFGTGTDVDPILRKGSDNPNNYQLCIANSYVSLKLDENDDDGLSGSTTLSVGVWYHVSGIWNGTTRQVLLNGVVDGSGSRTGTIGTDTRDLFIGGRTGSSDVFNGIIDEVRLSNVARTTGWILTEYTNQNNPSAFYSLSTEQIQIEAAAVENPLAELEIAWRQ
jgi:hypothetical protein